MVRTVLVPAAHREAFATHPSLYRYRGSLCASVLRTPYTGGHHEYDHFYPICCGGGHVGLQSGVGQSSVSADEPASAHDGRIHSLPRAAETSNGCEKGVPACDGLRSFAFFSSAWYCASAALPSEPPWEVAPPPIIVVVCGSEHSADVRGERGARAAVPSSAMRGVRSTRTQ